MRKTQDPASCTKQHLGVNAEGGPDDFINMAKSLLIAVAVMSLIVVLMPGSSVAARARADAVPTIISFTPHSGSVGTQVAIRGSNFLGASVAFNGVSTGMTVTCTGDNSSDYELSAPVPTEATTGFMTVTTPGGTAKTAIVFTVTPGNLNPAKGRPLITSFAPGKSVAGAMITITGANFGELKYIKIGGVKVAYYKPLSPTSLAVRVPRGAKTGRIMVATPLGMAASAASLVIG